MAFGLRIIWWPFLTLPSPLGEGGFPYAALLLLFPDQIEQMVLVKFIVPAEPIDQALKTQL
jgi:hypothetical protein